MIGGCLNVIASSEIGKDGDAALWDDGGNYQKAECAVRMARSLKANNSTCISDITVGE